MQQGSLFWGTYDFESPAFEWGSDYQRPNLPWQDLIVYEMPVRSFTADTSSAVGSGKQGTFQGITEKVCPRFLALRSLAFQRDVLSPCNCRATMQAFSVSNWPAAVCLLQKVANCPALSCKHVRQTSCTDASCVPASAWSVCSVTAALPEHRA